MGTSGAENGSADLTLGEVRDRLFAALAEQTARELDDDVRARPSTATPAPNLRVGIVGGGQAGLYAALLLEAIGIDYLVLEASTQRLGGRVDTHYFDAQPHQYAELGAMRFPESPLQSRLFATWDYLNKTASSTPSARKIPKIPYVLFDDKAGGNPDPQAGNLLCYNGKAPVTRNLSTTDNLGFNEQFKGPEFDRFKNAQGQLLTAGELQTRSLAWMIKLFQQRPAAEVIEVLMGLGDYSARSYLEKFGDTPPGTSGLTAAPGTGPYPSQIVDYLETTQSYTGIFDTSFTEYALDYYSFDGIDPGAPKRAPWWAMDGGTSRITEELANRIPRAKIRMGAEVIGVQEAAGKATVRVRGGGQETFDHVIITLPFNVLRMLDTPRDWSAGKYQAIRTLEMTNAVKVALGFTSRFWEKPGPFSTGMRGGQSNTDLAVRSVVYPSFGIGEPGPAYLLGTYSWQLDADKWTHLDEDAMFEVILRDLGRLHGDSTVRQAFLGKGASVVWNRSPLAGGGFAFFGPGQWRTAFRDGQAVQGRFHFAGEHLDLVHYWIAGAYNSAFRTVWEVIYQEGLAGKLLEPLRAALGGGDIFPWMYPALPAFRDTRFARAVQASAHDRAGAY